MKRILIIEDNKLNLELLIQLLEGKYEIFSAEDGETGLKTVKEHTPDLVILDMSLPVFDGYEIAKKIKADKESKNVKIIGLSSRAMIGDAEKALNAGCDDYLTKPLDEDLLFEKLKFHLKAN